MDGFLIESFLIESVCATGRLRGAEPPAARGAMRKSRRRTQQCSRPGLTLLALRRLTAGVGWLRRPF